MGKLVEKKNNYNRYFFVFISKFNFSVNIVHFKFCH